MKKAVLGLAICTSLTSIDALAAQLQPGDRLTIVSGSYFIAGGGAFGPPIPILGEQGIIVGPAQGDTGTDSHPGSPVSGDIGAVTQPWQFFCNTGYEFLSPTQGSGAFSGDTTNGVDMSAWAVTWNDIPGIPLGGCFQVPSGCTLNTTVFTDTGIGDFDWSGVYGQPYTIRYTAHIPVGDSSGLGGVKVDYFITGIVTEGGPLPPTSDVDIDLPGGATYECSAGGAVVNASVDVTTTDINDILSIEWSLDGDTVAAGDDNPSVEAIMGINVADHDGIKLNRGVNKLMLQGDMLADSVVLSVKTADAAGRGATVEKVLSQ